MDLASPAFRRIHAPAKGKVMKKMEAAVLEIPVLGLPGGLLLDLPQVNQRFLHQIVAQRGIGGQTHYNSSELLQSLQIFDQHSMSFSGTLRSTAAGGVNCRIAAMDSNPAAEY